MQLGEDPATVSEIRPPPPHKINKTISANSSLNNSCDVRHNSSGLRVNLVEHEGYFQIDKPTPECQVYVLTITIAFARNLIRVCFFLIAEHKCGWYFKMVFLRLLLIIVARQQRIFILFTSFSTTRLAPSRSRTLCHVRSTARGRR